MAITTPVNDGGSGGAGAFVVSDPSGSSVNATELVFQDGSLSITDTTGYIRPIVNNGARYTTTELSNYTLTMALSANDKGAPLRDLSSLDAQLKSLSGPPLYGETGFFSGGNAIKVGRSYGVFTRQANAFLAPQSTTSGGHTISFWAKPEGNASGQVGYFWSFYNGSNDRFWLFNDTTSIRVGDNNASFISANVTYTALNGLATPIDIFDGAFHLFTAVREHDGSGRHLYFYIDGQLVAENNDTAGLEIYNSASVFNIAGQNNDNTVGAIFTFDEFVISNTAWDQAAVTEAYNAHTGVSFVTSIETEYGFVVDPVSNYNEFITHIWLMDEAGATAADSVSSVAALTGEGTYTREVTGRWSGTTATRIDPSNGSRFVRRDSFDGPDANTPFAVSMDILFNSSVITSSSGGLFEGIFEIAVEAAAGGTTRFSLQLDEGPVLRVFNGSDSLNSEATSINTDGQWHSVTFGHRIKNNVRELFLCLDGVIYINRTSITWNDLSGSTVDIAIGENLTWGSGGTSNLRYAGFDVQNVVMWKNVSFDDEVLWALNGAQLTEIVR